MYDRVVIQDILKEIAQTQQVDLNAKQRFKGDPNLLTLRSLLTADPQLSLSTKRTRLLVTLKRHCDGLWKSI